MATNYEIRIKGRVGDSVIASFDDMTAVVHPPETVLTGAVSDQAQLHGLLQRIEMLGLELIEIRRVGSDAG